MRFLIFVIWLFLGWFYWKCQNSCCQSSSPSTNVETVTDSGITDANAVKDVAAINPIIKKLTPLKFNCSEASPTEEPEWVQFRDSLISKMGEQEVLQIEGKYFLDEINSGKDNLGMKRARNVLKLFDSVNSDKIRLSSSEKGDSCLQDQLNNLIAFRFLRQSKKIVQTSADMSTIYFEYNSIKKLNDEEVETYLDEVLNRLRNSSEKVKLIGHTDNDGASGYNYQLGENRATVIADYLIRNGLNPNRIIVDSRGEMEPIATNDTDEGMAKNRRTDLIIID